MLHVRQKIPSTQFVNKIKIYILHPTSSLPNSQKWLAVANCDKINCTRKPIQVLRIKTNRMNRVYRVRVVYVCERWLRVYVAVGGRSLDPFLYTFTAHIVIYLRHLPKHTHNMDVLSHTRAREFHRLTSTRSHHPHLENRAPSILEYFIDLCKSTLTKNIIIFLQLYTAIYDTHPALPLRLLSCDASMFISVLFMRCKIPKSW